MARVQTCADCGRLAVRGYVITTRGRVCRDRVSCEARTREAAGQLQVEGCRAHPSTDKTTAQLRLG